MSDVERRNRLAPFVVASLVAVGAADIWWSVTSLHRASYALRIEHGQELFIRADAQHFDHDVRVAALATLVAELLAAALFITWLYRLVRDLDRRRPGTLRYGTGWAIGGWFVPFLSLVRPKQVINDAWRVSSPIGSWARAVPAWLMVWWLTFLISNFLTGILFYSRDETLDVLATRDRIHAAGAILNAVAAVLAILVVRALSRRADQVPDGVGVQPVGPYGLRFNPAPGWPAPPAAWTPPHGWEPDPSWPPAPANWQFWIP